MFTTLGATFLMTGAKLVVIFVSRDRGADSTLIFGGTEARSPLFDDDALMAAKIAAPMVPDNSRLKNDFPILFIMAFPFLILIRLARPPRLRTCVRRGSLVVVSSRTRNIFRVRDHFL